MPDTEQGQTGLPDNSSGETLSPEGGFLHIEDDNDRQEAEQATNPILASLPKPALPLPAQASERTGTVEHLAARRAMPELNTSSPEVKQLLVTTRSAVTRLLTELRWEGKSVEATADGLIPHLNVGPIQQWQPVLLPLLLEIDRAGNLIPVWLDIIARGDPADLPPSANPAETEIGRARRYAIVMLGNYKSVSPAPDERSLGFSKQGASISKGDSDAVVRELGTLVSDPNTSLYAAQALVNQGTTAALQALVKALKGATGWAKVDIVDACLTLKQERFNDILVTSGFDNAQGLESYIALPIYRTIPLQGYLRASGDINPRLTQQAALIFSQVVTEAMVPPRGEVKTLPVLFERDLATTTRALFDGTRSNPMWQNTIALHRLAMLLGRYWQAVSHQEIKDARIVDAVYQCVPMMNDVERWMDGPGRDVLLKTIEDADEDALNPVVKAMGDLHDPRAISPLLSSIEATHELTTQSHALAVGSMIDTLGKLGDRRALVPLQTLLDKVVDMPARQRLPRRADSLPTGDQNIPGSIIYAAVVRALGQFNDRSALNTIRQGASDVDPYVRTQSLEAMRRLDPDGSDYVSRQVARDALSDPSDEIARLASQIVLQYHDMDAIAPLQDLIERRPALAPQLYNTLHQLRQ